MLNIAIIFLLCVMTTPLLAATIYLKDGRTVTGNIVQETKDAVRVEANGGIMTYFNDEIKSIDKTSAPAPAATVPAVDTTPVEISPAKRELILKFMDVFGTKQALAQNFEALMQQAQLKTPTEANKIRERLKTEDIIEELLPIYARNFTDADLKAFIDFYGSAEGKKLIATIPVLMRQSVEVMTVYLQTKFPELTE